MLESFVPALAGLLTTAKAMASFDSFRKGRKGDVRVLIEELKENSRLCFRVVLDDVDCSVVVPKFSTVEFDRLIRSGFNFNAIQSKKIQPVAGIDKTDLVSWPGKTTTALIVNIYDKIKNLKSVQEFVPESPTRKRRLINIHKRILLLLHHANG